MSADAAEAEFHAIDTNGSGAITFDEFKVRWSRPIGTIHKSTFAVRDPGAVVKRRVMARRRAASRKAGARGARPTFEERASARDENCESVSTYFSQTPVCFSPDICSPVQRREQ